MDNLRLTVIRGRILTKIIPSDELLYIANKRKQMKRKSLEL